MDDPILPAKFYSSYSDMNQMFENQTTQRVTLSFDDLSFASSMKPGKVETLKTQMTITQIPTPIL